MARLIEVENSQSLPEKVVLQVGDLLVLKVSGGQVISGTDVVEILGPFQASLLLNNGDIMSPMGAPNTLMLLARQPGQAQLNVVTGDPWYSPEIKQLVVVVKS